MFMTSILNSTLKFEINSSNSYIIYYQTKIFFMKLSVALCTYNGESFIKQQIDSILQQELPVDEIVICDDDSTDKTISIIESYKQKYHYPIFILKQNKKNMGVRKNFEYAISLCSGDIIFLSDQDDIWQYEKTRKIVDFFNNNPKINLVFTNAKLIDKNNKEYGTNTLFDVVGLQSLMKVWNDGLTFEIENVIQRLLGSTFGIRKVFANQCLPFNNNIKNLHDGQLAMQAIINDCIAMLPESLIQYRLHDKNVIGLGGNRKFHKISFEESYKFILEPREVSSLFKYSKNKNFNKRISFYQKRFNCYSSTIGKLTLIISIFQYIKFYKKYWLDFYTNDIMYGVKSKFKKIFIKTR